MIEFVLAVVVVSCIFSSIVWYMAKRKYQALLRAEMEERERMAKLEVARMQNKRRRKKQEFIEQQFGRTTLSKK